MRRLDVAAGYAALGDKDHALENLRKSAARREVGITGLKVNPVFEALRSNPRFLTLEREIGIEQ
jgi:hypothetical protein